MRYLEARTALNTVDMKNIINELYNTLGKDNIYILKRQNVSGYWKIYAYRRTDLYTTPPKQPRKAYAPRTRNTVRPRGIKYKRKIPYDDIVSILSLVEDKQVVNFITDKLNNAL